VVVTASEVIVPMARKDYWNAQPPHRDSQFAQFVAKPEVGGLLPGHSQDP
jgi:hypothetical protein